MDRTQLLLGKLLGELYQIKKGLELPNTPQSFHIYGLLHGFESSIDAELVSIGSGVSCGQEDAVLYALEAIDTEPSRSASFRGFYDLEDELEAKGKNIDRFTVGKILTKLRAEERFEKLMRVIDTPDCPTEMRPRSINDGDIFS